MFNAGFLRRYVAENPNVDIEEVLNDEEILDELRIKEDSFFKYLSNYMESLINYLTIEPTIYDDHKRTFKYPYISCEIFLSNSQIIKNKLFNTEDNYLNLEKLVLYFLNESGNQTLQGYISRILLKLIKYNSNQIKQFLISKPEILNEMLNKINLNGVSDIVFKLLMLKKDMIEFEPTRRELILKISNKFHNYVEKSLECDFSDEITSEALIAYLSIFSRLLPVVNNVETLSEMTFEILFNDKFYDKISEIYLVKSDRKMLDTQITLSRNYIYLIEELNKFIESLVSNVLDTENIRESIYDYSELMDYDFNQKVEPKDDNLSDNVKVKSNYYSSNIDVNIPASLSSLITIEQISLIRSFLKNNIIILFDIQEKIRNFKKNQKIDQPNNVSISPISSNYISFIEILISIARIKNDEELKSLIESNVEITSKIIQIAENYSNSTIFVNKILNFFEILISNDPQLIILKKLIEIGVYQEITSSIDFEKIIDKEKNIIHSRNNSVFNLRILSLFNQKIKDSENHSILKFEQEINIYNELNKGLLSNEVENYQDVKDKLYQDEKVVVEKEKSLFDSEAYLSTTKKNLENSKKMRSKLNKLDDTLNK